MELAFELTPLVAAKLMVYTIGSLVHLFLMVLILGQRGLRRLEWLLFWLMAALFMWYSGNLLGLNIGLFYGWSPVGLTGAARLIAFLGLMWSIPLVVHVHAEYAAQGRGLRLPARSLVALFCLPLIGAPWLVGRLLGRPTLGALIALEPWSRPIAFSLVAALAAAGALNLSISLRREFREPHQARLHRGLATLQLALAAGLAWTYLVLPLPTVGLGGIFPTILMLIAVAPSGLLLYWMFRYTFLNLRVQRNLVYAVVAIFAGLVYLNLTRRLSGFLEMREILPSAVTEAVMIFFLVIFLEPVKNLINRALHAAFVSQFERVQKFSTEIQDYAKQSGDVAALARFVEERAPAELGLTWVALRFRGKQDATRAPAGHPGRVYAFPVRRGEESLATLEVIPPRPELSGDQVAALQLLTDQLAAALELCQLITAKVQLERALAEKAKLAFLGEMAARIAHNVKNPLSSMKTLMQLLEEDASLPERVRQDCRLVINEIDRLNANISHLLRYAKPARDSDRPVDLVAVSNRVLALARAEADRCQVRLEFVSPPAPCPVEGGEEAANDIVSNLVVNALEASGPGGTVRVRLAREALTPDRVELYVEDEGPGIARELKEKIFQPFFTTRPGGTGLGLAIVARRVEEIGGTVECISPLASDRGTRFRVSLCVAQSKSTTTQQKSYALHPDR